MYGTHEFDEDVVNAMYDEIVANSRFNHIMSKFCSLSGYVNDDIFRYSCDGNIYWMIPSIHAGLVKGVGLAFTKLECTSLDLNGCEMWKRCDDESQEVIPEYGLHKILDALILVDQYYLENEDDIDNEHEEKTRKYNKLRIEMELIWSEFGWKEDVRGDDRRVKYRLDVVQRKTTLDIIKDNTRRNYEDREKKLSADLSRHLNNDDTSGIYTKVLTAPYGVCERLFNCSNTKVEDVDWLCSLLVNGVYDDSCLGFISTGKPGSLEWSIGYVNDDFETIIREDDLNSLLDCAIEEERHSTSYDLRSDTGVSIPDILRSAERKEYMRAKTLMENRMSEFGWQEKEEIVALSNKVKAVIARVGNKDQVILDEDFDDYEEEEQEWQ